MLPINDYSQQVKLKSDRMMNHFLAGFFITGLIFAGFYDTWIIALCVGSISLFAYYLTKYIWPESNAYQYVLSGVFAVFMAQYIFQMHGLFEMHFVAFIGSAILITYQNWKLQIPIAVAVVIHHALFGYLQFMGMSSIYFTQLEYMDLSTFIIHVSFASFIFFLCGLWSYNIKKYTEQFIKQSYEIGRLQIADKQREELCKANMELDKFVYGVSHDLRAPLKSISGIVTITEEETTDPAIKEYMEMIKGSITRLDDFIVDILNYSRNARAEIRESDVDFEGMLKDIKENLKYMGDDHRMVNIYLNINSKKPFRSDKSRISVVLNNLISNAIRYQNPSVTDAYVEVNVITDETEAVITIKDNGIGINKEQHAKIFEMFYRVTENSVGSGLGLYLVKETIDKLNGLIQIDSEPGVGTSFKLNIPNLFHQI
ncbi:MAG: HAMP domain-containing sensor histidine kinase [Bacteroidota bacterium]